MLHILLIFHLFYVTATNNQINRHKKFVSNASNSFEVSNFYRERHNVVVDLVESNINKLQQWIENSNENKLGHVLFEFDSIENDIKYKSIDLFIYNILSYRLNRCMIRSFPNIKFNNILCLLNYFNIYENPVIGKYNYLIMVATKELSSCIQNKNLAFKTYLLLKKLYTAYCEYSKLISKLGTFNYQINYMQYKVLDQDEIMDKFMNLYYENEIFILDLWKNISNSSNKGTHLINNVERCKNALILYSVLSLHLKNTMNIICNSFKLITGRNTFCLYKCKLDKIEMNKYINVPCTIETLIVEYFTSLITLRSFIDIKEAVN